MCHTLLPLILTSCTTFQIKLLFFLKDRLFSKNFYVAPSRNVNLLLSFFQYAEVMI